MAKQTNVVEVGNDWTLISTGKESVIVTLKDDVSFRIALADADTDLAAGDGHDLNIAATFYGVPSNVYARRTGPEDGETKTLCVTAY